MCEAVGGVDGRKKEGAGKRIEMSEGVRGGLGWESGGC